MKQRKFLALILAAALSAGLLAGCGSESASSETDDSTQEVSTDSYSLSVVTSITSSPINPLVQVAEVEGYFADNGLEIEYYPLESSVFEALSTGKVDTTYGQLIPGLSYGAQGSDVTIFAGTQSGGMAAITTEENYEYYSDLENWNGVNIGVIQLSTSEMVTKYALKNLYGYEKDEELTYTYIDEYANVVLSVQKGTVDVGFIPSNFVESAESQGLVVLFPLTYLMEDFVCCRQTAYSSSIEENREAYVAYLKSQILAYKVYSEDEETTVADVMEESDLDEDTVSAYIYDADASANRKYNPDPNYNGTLAVYEILLENEYVESGTELSEFFDISIYADALQEVIAENEGEEFYEDMWTYFVEHNNEYPDFEETYGA